MEFHFKKHNKPNRKNGIKICNPGTILFFQLHTFVHRIYIENLKYERYEQSHFTFNIQYFNNNQYGTKKIKQTAGRDQLGTFAPKFAELNDDILFGEVWSRTEQLGLRDRSLVTITSLISQGITDSSLTFHLQSAKNNGITRTEIAEIITQIGFYAGWPKAWAAFRLAKEVWNEEISCKDKDEKTTFQREMIFLSENQTPLMHNISLVTVTSPLSLVNR